MSPSQTRNIFIVTVTATNILITFTTLLPVNGLYFVIITTTIEKYLITPLCYLSLNKKILSFFWLFVCVKKVTSMTVLIATYDSLSQYFKKPLLMFLCWPNIYMNITQVAKIRFPPSATYFIFFPRTLCRLLKTPFINPPPF